MHTLAPAGRSQSETHTNMSTVMSLSIFNQRGEEVSLEVSDDQPIEFFIPRDPYLILRPMALQNATSKTIKEAFDYQLIDLDHLVGNTGLTVSVHFEIQPLNPNLAYAFVYRFDPTLQIDDLKTQIDGWSRFCPSSKCVWKK